MMHSFCIHYLEYKTDVFVVENNSLMEPSMVAVRWGVGSQMVKWVKGVGVKYPQILPKSTSRHI